MGNLETYIKNGAVKRVFQKLRTLGRTITPDEAVELMDNCNPIHILEAAQYFTDDHSLAISLALDQLKKSGLTSHAEIVVEKLHRKLTTNELDVLAENAARYSFHNHWDEALRAIHLGAGVKGLSTCVRRSLNTWENPYLAAFLELANEKGLSPDAGEALVVHYVKKGDINSALEFAKMIPRTLSEAETEKLLTRAMQKGDLEVAQKAIDLGVGYETLKRYVRWLSGKVS